MATCCHNLVVYPDRVSTEDRSFFSDLFNTLTDDELLTLAATELYATNIKESFTVEDINAHFDFDCKAHLKKLIDEDLMELDVHTAFPEEYWHGWEYYWFLKGQAEVCTDEGK